MRCLGLVIVLCLHPAQLVAAGLIGDDWWFQRGAAEAWRAPEFQPQGWSVMNMGVSWERQHVPNYARVTLRQKVSIPARWSDVPLRFSLRMHAQRTDVYCNGEPLLVSVPKDELTTIELPPDFLRADGVLHFALEVRQHEWTGGEAVDLIELRPVDGDLPEVAIEPLIDVRDHVFAAQAEISLRIRLRSNETEAIAGTFQVSAVSDLHKAVYSHQRLITVEHGSVIVPLSLGRLEPGFYQVVARFNAPGVHAQHVLWIAVAPEQIESLRNPPPDLEKFWNEARRELASIPPKFRVIAEPEHSTARHYVSTIEMQSVGDVTLRAWLLVPARAGRFPATLHLPGYGTALQPEWFAQDDDRIHLALDIRGHGRSADVFNPGFRSPGFVEHNVYQAEAYAYRGAFLDVGRALEFLAQHEQVDAQQIAVEGMSQGGGLALAAAALWPERVAACAAGVPFLADFETHIRIRPIYGDDIAASVARYPGATWSDALRTMSLVDVKNLAPWIRCPVMITVGLFDDDCPPRLGSAVYNNLSAPRTFVVRPTSSHMLDRQWGTLSREWIRSQFSAKEVFSGNQR